MGHAKDAIIRYNQAHHKVELYPYSYEPPENLWDNYEERKEWSRLRSLNMDKGAVLEKPFSDFCLLSIAIGSIM